MWYCRICRKSIRQLRFCWTDCLSWSTVVMIPRDWQCVTVQRDVEIVKAKGRLKVLAEKTNDGKALAGDLRHRPYPLGDPRRAIGD